MNDFINNYTKSYEGLNKWVKFLLNFLWGIPTNLYRVARSIKKNDTLGAIVGIILLAFCGCWVIAITDLITIAVYDKLYWFDFNEMKFFSSKDSDVEVKDATKSDNNDESKDADKID